MVGVIAHYRPVGANESARVKRGQRQRLLSHAQTQQTDLAHFDLSPVSEPQHAPLIGKKGQPDVRRVRVANGIGGNALIVPVFYTEARGEPVRCPRKLASNL